MPKSNKIAQLAGLYGLMASMDVYGRESFSDDVVSKRTVVKDPNYVHIHKGHKKFVIDGIEVYALNYKNALKKVNKIKKNLLN